MRQFSAPPNLRPEDVPNRLISQADDGATMTGHALQAIRDQIAGNIAFRVEREVIRGIAATGHDLPKSPLDVQAQLRSTTEGGVRTYYWNDAPLIAVYPIQTHPRDAAKAYLRIDRLYEVRRTE